MAGTVRVDWQAIKARWGSQVGDFHLALLPKGACQLLLAIADRLHWEATYRIEGYDFSDWDELQEIVDLGLGGLTDTVRLADLLGHIDEIEDLLAALVAKDVCCGQPLDGIEELLPDPTPIIGDEPDETGSDIEVGVGDPPEPAEDWDDYNERLCEAAQKYADGLPKVIDAAETLQSVVQGLTIVVLAAVIASLFPLLGLSVAVVGVALTALELIERANELRSLLADETGWDEMREDLVDHRQEIVCAILTADTPLQASQQLETTIKGFNEGAWNIIRLLTLPGNNMNRIFNMQSEVVGGFYGPCGECDRPQVASGHFWDQDIHGSMQTVQEACPGGVLTNKQYTATCTNWAPAGSRAGRISYHPMLCGPGPSYSPSYPGTWGFTLEDYHTTGQDMAYTNGNYIVWYDGPAANVEVKTAPSNGVWYPAPVGYKQCHIYGGTPANGSWKAHYEIRSLDE